MWNWVSRFLEPFPETVKLSSTNPPVLRGLSLLPPPSRAHRRTHAYNARVASASNFRNLRASAEHDSGSHCSPCSSRVRVAASSVLSCLPRPTPTLPGFPFRKVSHEHQHDHVSGLPVRLHRRENAHLSPRRNRMNAQSCDSSHRDRNALTDWHHNYYRSRTSNDVSSVGARPAPARSTACMTHPARAAPGAAGRFF
eukprot:COSAG02_NODE_2518_length_8611_cov_1282.272560_1_plen_197_part_00